MIPGAGGVGFGIARAGARGLDACQDGVRAQQGFLPRSILQGAAHQYDSPLGNRSGSICQWAAVGPCRDGGTPCPAGEFRVSCSYEGDAGGGMPAVGNRSWSGVPGRAGGADSDRVARCDRGLCQ